MIDFHTHDGTYLLGVGKCLKSQLEHQGSDGINAVEGKPEGFDYSIPKLGHRWNIHSKCWEDCRSATEKKADDAREVIKNRLENYPPLGELADALVHQQLGDSTYLDEYINKCIQVKQSFPKVK